MAPLMPNSRLFAGLANRRLAQFCEGFGDESESESVKLQMVRINSVHSTLLCSPQLNLCKVSSRRSPGMTEYVSQSDNIYQHQLGTLAEIHHGCHQQLVFAT